MIEISWLKFCLSNIADSMNIKLNTATRFTSDMYIYRVTIDSADEMNFLEDFEGLYAAEETKPLALTLDALEFDEASMVRVPDPEENYPLAGVLDTGIAGISYLKPWKEAKEHTNYPVEYQNNAQQTEHLWQVLWDTEMN